VTLKLAETSLAKSRPSVPYRANFIIISFLNVIVRISKVNRVMVSVILIFYCQYYGQSAVRTDNNINCN